MSGASPPCSGAAYTAAGISQLIVVQVSSAAVEEILQSVDARAFQVVPETSCQQRLAVVAVFLADVRGCALGSEEVLGADLHPALGATGDVDVEPLRHLLTLHALAAVHDISVLVLVHGRRVFHR